MGHPILNILRKWVISLNIAFFYSFENPCSEKYSSTRSYKEFYTPWHLIQFSSVLMGVNITIFFITSFSIILANEGKNLHRPLKITENCKTEKYQLTEFINNHLNKHCWLPSCQMRHKAAGIRKTFTPIANQQEPCSQAVFYKGKRPCKPVK